MKTVEPDCVPVVVIDSAAGSAYVKFLDGQIASTIDLMEGEVMANLDLEAGERIVGLEVVGVREYNLRYSFHGGIAQRELGRRRH